MWTAVGPGAAPHFDTRESERYTCGTVGRRQCCRASAAGHTGPEVRDVLLNKHVGRAQLQTALEEPQLISCAVVLNMVEVGD